MRGGIVRWIEMRWEKIWISLIDEDVIFYYFIYTIKFINKTSYLIILIMTFLKFYRSVNSSLKKERERERRKKSRRSNFFLRSHFILLMTEKFEESLFSLMFTLSDEKTKLTRLICLWERCFIIVVSASFLEKQVVWSWHHDDKREDFWFFELVEMLVLLFMLLKLPSIPGLVSPLTDY